MKQKELLLHRIAAKFIVNEEIDIELTGKPAEIDCLYELLTISKNLKEALCDKSTTLNEVLKIVEAKKDITKKFESLTGITWRL